MIRDRKYLDSLHQQSCVITGRYGDDNETIDAMHIGTAGKGIKSSDDQALPVTHSMHVLAHQKGEVSMLRQYAPDWLIREAFRAYARQLYQEWLTSQAPR
jgi:hypothetical protein